MGKATSDHHTVLCYTGKVDKDCAGDHADRKPATCYACVHRLNVPGSAHSRCNNVEAKVSAHPQGVRGGWFRWPLNFDPTWLKTCDGFSDDAADKKPRVEHDPLVELMGILG